MDSKIIDVGRLNKREISYYNFKKKNRINYYCNGCLGFCTYFHITQH